MEIPALWTDLTEAQRNEGRAYVNAVFFLAMRSRDAHFRITYARDSIVRCGDCGCPIGRNHNYLKPDYPECSSVCFACAEQDYHNAFMQEDYLEADEFDLEERELYAPMFLNLHRIPKEVRNP